jgi:phosphomannomutase/phosphoglucomutase
VNDSMSSLPTHVFRAYDVRGIAQAEHPADVELDPNFAEVLGRAYGTFIRREVPASDPERGHRVCLARDCRIHGEALHRAFSRGVRSTGVHVIDVGVVASPMLYFAVHFLGTDGGVQVTGSHNPSNYNGFKMMRGRSSLYGEAIQTLRQTMLSGDCLVGEGQETSHPIFEDYVSYVTENLSLGARPLRVVVDGGNGTGGPPAVALLQRLGVEVIPLYIEMDGRFPNHHPDPTVAENLTELIAAVRREGADLGVAYDGDADRIGVVDDQGEILWGDRLLILLARHVLAELPGSAIVSEVKCSKTLFEDIEAHGGRAIMSAVGHSIIKSRMKAEGAQLAGEMSGHIFFQHRWFGFDDAVYTTGRLLEILSRTETPLSALLSDVPVTHVTPEIRLECPDDVKFRVVDAAVAQFSETHDVIDIDGARVSFEGGWGLIRASNTQPVIVLRAEAETAAGLADIRQTLEDFVRDHATD